MPHKHKRQKPNPTETAQLFDLPPSQRANPLPSSKHPTSTPSSLRRPAKKRTPKTTADDGDTPRAFARLLQFQRTGKGVRRGLDEGRPRAAAGKKRKAATAVEDGAGNASLDAEVGDTHDAETVVAAALPVPFTFQPGERLSDFGQRVNQALPISGLAKKGKSGGGGGKVTKHEKRLKKMQSQWREEEVKILEKEEEAREIAEEEWEEQVAGMDKEARAMMAAVGGGSGGGKKGKKGKKRSTKVIGEVDAGEDDPWAVLETRREAPKGLHDVALEPPKFGRLPKELFKGAQVGDVPKQAGSLRRREGLGQTRNEIIQSYRMVMAQNRAAR
jgi:hypothetical protein